MDIKYTIEILTKDIQDIENLVGKLQNSKEASAIELDLAMSKLRNVYEILTMIKADRLNELVDPSPGDTETVPETQAEPGPEDEAVAPDETAPETGAKAPDETAPEVEAMDQAARAPNETSIHP